MYELVNKDNVLSAISSGAELYIVDIPTHRIINCADMTLGAVKKFIEKTETMFFRVAANG